MVTEICTDCSSLRAEVDRLITERDEAESLALAVIHCICADAGVDPGHVVKRVQDLADRALAAEAKVRELEAAMKAAEDANR